MGVQERKAREKEELRQEILEAARDLFVEQGYEAVSMRKIAERIEYSPATIYLYFRDKADLFDNLCADTFQRLVERLESMTGEHENALSGLRAGLRAYIDFGLEHPAHYTITFMTPNVRHCEHAESKSDCMGERAFGNLVKGVAMCAEAGLLRVNNVELTSQMLWSGIHGITSLLITHPDFPWAERDQIIDHLLDTLIGGLKP
jgi:AcrR family transcriptional regulator